MKKERSIEPSIGEVIAKTKEKRERDKRSRKWQLTENNPDYTKREAVERLARIGDTIYCIGCSEEGDSGTSHIHAFVVFKNAISMGSIKKSFPRAHLEYCKGSVPSNVDYIRKADPQPFELGELPLVVSEEREDVPSEVVAIMLECGLSPLDILRNYPQYCDYIVRNFKNLNEIYEKASKRFR